MAYAALAPRALARASDSDLYNFALNYAQSHAFGTPTGVAGTVAGPAAAPGLAATFATPARLELGRINSQDALARRKVLAASLARRTTEASRKRVAQRLAATYGFTF